MKETKMAYLDDIAWTIMDIFDEIFLELYLIQLAIDQNDIFSLLAVPPPQDFDPLQTIGRY